MTNKYSETSHRITTVLVIKQAIPYLFLFFLIFYLPASLHVIFAWHVVKATKEVVLINPLL